VEEKKPDRTPEPGRLKWALKRWAELGGQLQCPQCGTGRLPESRFCLKCGAELPPIRHEESPEALERKRPSRRALNWLVDLVPGILSPKVTAASLAAALVGIVGLRAAFGIFAGISPGMGFAAIFAFFYFCSVAFGSALVYLSGLGWLLCGRVCPFWEACSELRLKQLLLALVLAALAFRIALWLL